MLLISLLLTLLTLLSTVSCSAQIVTSQSAICQQYNNRDECFHTATNGVVCVWCPSTERCLPGSCHNDNSTALICPDFEVSPFRAKTCSVICARYYIVTTILLCLFLLFIYICLVACVVVNCNSKYRVKIYALFASVLAIGIVIHIGFYFSCHNKALTISAAIILTLLVVLILYCLGYGLGLIIVNNDNSNYNIVVNTCFHRKNNNDHLLTPDTSHNIAINNDYHSINISNV